MQRRFSRSIQVGSVAIGGEAPIVVQSMLSTDTRDVATSAEQLQRLTEAGCELVRVAVPHADALEGFGELVERSTVPIVADIHFDYKLALGALERGAAKLRINPGNMPRMADVDAVIEAAGECGVPIRIGVNAGSLAKDFAGRADMTLAEKLVESALSYAEHFENRGFKDIVLSVKASSVPVTVAAYRELAARCDHPLHIGVTEAGTYERGTVKSAVGLGMLLSEGIGDTLRVSLTADPVKEVGVAWRILEALDLRRHGPELISCPTCGRCEIDLFSIVAEVEERLKGVGSDVKVAVMGCVVNGPGEAREADFGIAGGRGMGMLFSKGETVRKVPESELVDALFEEISR